MVASGLGFWIRHDDTPQSVRLPWTGDRAVAKTFTCQHITLKGEPERDIHASGAIRTRNLKKRSAAEAGFTYRKSNVLY